MDETLHDDELLMRYIDGELTAEERQSFEQKLQNDSALRERLEKLRLAADAIPYYAIAQQVASVHKKMVADVAPEVTAEKRRVVNLKKLVRYSMAVAASVLLLFIAVKGYHFVQLSPDAVYSQAFVPYTLSNTRSGQNNATAIEDAYNESRYNEVIASGEQNRSITTRQHFLIGLSYLQINNPAAAINEFEKVMQSAAISKEPVYEGAEYYLSLAYLKNKNYEKALEVMKRIRNNANHVYSKNVSEKLINDVKLLKLKKSF